MLAKKNRWVVWALGLAIVAAISSPEQASCAEVCFYDFEGNLDDSGAGTPLDMTDYGTLTYSTNTPISGLGYAFGGQSLQFGPPYSFGYVNPGTNLKLELETFTIEAWVKLSELGSYQSVLHYTPQGSGISARGFAIVIVPDGKVQGTVGATGPVGFVNSTTALSTDSWYHLAMTYDKSTGLTQLFINGTLDATKILGSITYEDLPGYGPIPKTIYIGQSHNANSTGPTYGPDLGNQFRSGGLIDRIIVNDTVLTAAELDYNYPFSQNQPPVANAGENQTVECTGALTEVALNGSASGDPDGDAIEFEWSVPDGVLLDDRFSATPTGLFPLGPTLVTLTVTDGNGGVDVDDVLITVLDTLPPVVVCTTDIASLFPANHKMVDVTVCVQASDACVCPENLLVQCTVSSSEPDDGTGDGSSVGDVDGSDGYVNPVLLDLVYDEISACYVGTVALRAERDGTQSGRTYSIVTEVMDSSLNAATASCVVVVPHDKRKK